MVDTAVIVKGASALVTPTAGNGHNRKRRMHIGHAISLTGKAITQAEEGLRRTADHRSEGFDLLFGYPGN